MLKAGWVTGRVRRAACCGRPGWSIFRPVGASSLLLFYPQLALGLHSYTTSRLNWADLRAKSPLRLENGYVQNDSLSDTETVKIKNYWFCAGDGVEGTARIPLASKTNVFASGSAPPAGISRPFQRKVIPAALPILAT